MPGGIAEMVVMGSERGADERTVGLVHAARIFLVVLALPFVARLFPSASIGRSLPVVTGDTADLQLLAWSVGCIAVGLVLGRLLRLPAWHLVGPLIVSGVVHAVGLADFHLPRWIVVASQVGLGATIGCRFVGLTAREAGRTLALAAGSSVILLVLTLVTSAALSSATGLNPVLVILAYAPGGLAEMSMVALSLSLEPAFVVVHHLIRIGLVLAGAPLCFQISAGRAGSDV